MATRIDKKNSIAIKLSSFGDVEYMKKMNKIQSLLYIIEEGLLSGLNSKEIYNNVKLS